MNAHDQLERQLRASVARSADRGPAHRRRPRLPSWLPRTLSALSIAAITAMALGVAGFFLVALRHGRGPYPHLAPPRGGQHGSLGVPPRPERRYINQAFRQVANTPGSACHKPEYEPRKVHSKPGRELLSMMGVLGRPRTKADGLPATLQGFSGGSIYIDYVRRARVAAGVAYYVVPVTSMLLLGRSPACWRAIGAALRAERARIPAGLRAPTLALPDKFASYQRRLERQGDQPGVCLVEADAQGQAASCGATISQLKRFGLVSWDGVLAGIVPNGVASVTIDYPSLDGRPPPSATSMVTGNVFVFSSSGVAFRSYRPAMIWRSATGEIIRKIPSLGPFSGFNYGTRCVQNTQPRQRPPSVCLAPRGILGRTPDPGQSTPHVRPS